ncbi:molybdenum cofactor sulfurylase [Luteimonas cucumeris]|uniref:Molybdenum cofactor sulfurylase n=1 Tax=Luteimonas cucumeris TaxID=985012 RepID=A0A562L1V6_9GAMM|nr:XdhC/CoxI family protein [Luteimonas cucumeris]TWI01659.1 molybdenum cofactor sulfurylase [Luteimonas cucumeris]
MDEPQATSGAAAAAMTEPVPDVDGNAIVDIATPAFLAAGNPRPVVQATIAAARRGDAATLALVLETQGSTYSHAGAMALFASAMQEGWLSGGCLEPELARRAAQAAAEGRVEWIEIDTRDDAHLFSGSALGCRGRLRIALLPLAAMPHVDALLEAWLAGGVPLQRVLTGDGHVALQAGDLAETWQLPTSRPEWAPDAHGWSLPLAPMPEVLVLGAGPETPALLDLLRDLGWRTSLAEARERWRDAFAHADMQYESVSEALRQQQRYAAALVMHHSFERDRDALDMLAATPIPFIGLLGPPRRRDDLFKLLTSSRCAALKPRLHAPVGLDLGGQGPEAIALSIAAQLQAWRAQAGA